MKKAMLLLFSLCLVTAYAQEPSSEKKLAREQKKEIRKMQADSIARQVIRMIETRRFCMQINSKDEGQGWNGISSQMNYLALDSNRYLFQMEPDYATASSWGLTGLPVYGTFSDYSLQITGKHKDAHVLRLRATEHTGRSYDATIFITPSGYVTVQLNRLNGATLKLKGVMVPLDDSRFDPNLI
jgi:hypothetical protein